MTPVPVRINDVLSAAFALGRRAFAPLAIIAAVAGLPAAVLGAIAVRADGTLEASQVAAVLVLGPVALAVSVIALVASVILAARIADGGDAMEPADAGRAGLALAGPTLWVMLLALGGVLLGLVLLVLPGIWLSIAWALAIPVLALEGLRGREALGRSFRLVRGRWWRTFAILVVGSLLLAVVSSLVQLPFSAGGSGAAAIGSLLGNILTWPFITALLVVLYRALAAGVPAEAGPAPEAPWSAPAPGGAAPPSPRSEAEEAFGRSPQGGRFRPPGPGPGR